MSRIDEADDPRRRVLIQMLTAGVFSAGWAKSAMALDLFGRTPQRMPEDRSVFLIRGTAAVNGATCTMDTRIFPGDLVTTGENSTLIFVVGANSMILRSNAHLQLEGRKEPAPRAIVPAAPSAPASPPKPKESAPGPAKETSNFIITGLRLLSGALLSVSRSQGTAIRTPTATIGIRGTGVYLESDPEQTYFCTCYGLSDVAAADDPTSTDTVAATHHNKPLYILKDAEPGKAIRRAPFINHTDQELMLIETLVGRTPPFVFPGSQYSAPRRDY